MTARFPDWWRSLWTTIVPLAIVGVLTFLVARGFTMPTGLLASLVPGQTPDYTLGCAKTNGPSRI